MFDPTPKARLLKATDDLLEVGSTREEILLMIDNYIYKLQQEKMKNV